MSPVLEHFLELRTMIWVRQNLIDSVQKLEVFGLELVGIKAFTTVKSVLAIGDKECMYLVELVSPFIS